MESRRWVNQSQPQTLVIATFLLYFTAGFTLLFFGDRFMYQAAACGRSLTCGIGGQVDLLRLVLPAIAGAAAYGIANEFGWSWLLGIAAAAVPLAARLLASARLEVSPLSFDVISLLFDGALLALLVHPQSREYQRIWFTGGGQRRRR
ncbi:MAG: hypothetical protein ACR2H3_03290 [Acidimicrobiales bacterium]